MPEIDHTRLPSLKGQLEALREQGKQSEASVLQAQIDALTRETKVHATRTLSERERLKNAFDIVARRITKVREGGDAARDTELDSLTQRARDLKSRHDATNRELTSIRDSLTRVETPVRRSVRGRHAPPPDRVPPPDDRTNEDLLSSRTVDYSRRAESSGEPSGTGTAMTSVSPRALRTLVVSLLVLLVIGGGAFAGLSVLNSRLAAAAQSQVDSAITALGLSSAIEYEAVSVNAFRGRVSLSNVIFSDPIFGSVIAAESLYAEIPPAEAIRMRSTLAAPNSSAESQSRVPLAFSAATLGLTGATAEVPGVGTMAAGDFAISLAGDLESELLSRPPLEQLYAISAASLRVTDLRVDPSTDPFRAVAVEYVGPDSDLLSVARIRVDLAHDAEANVIFLEDLFVGTPLLAQRGSGRILYGVYEWGEPFPREVDLSSSTRLIGRARALTVNDPGGTPIGALDAPSMLVDAAVRLRFVDGSSSIDFDGVSGELSLEAGPFTAAFEPSLAAQVTQFVPFAQSLADGNMFGFERLGLRLRAPSLASIQLNELAYESDITDVAISGTGSLDPTTLSFSEYSLEGTAVRLPEPIREALGEFARELGVRVPESRIFSFEAERGADGQPSVSVRRGR